MMLGGFYHGALRFITRCKPFTHHHTLHFLVYWLLLLTCGLLHWILFIYKSLTGLLPVHLTSYLSHKKANSITFSVPSVHAKLGGEMASFLCSSFYFKQTTAGPDLWMTVPALNVLLLIFVFLFYSVSVWLPCTSSYSKINKNIWWLWCVSMVIFVVHLPFICSESESQLQWPAWWKMEKRYVSTLKWSKYGIVMMQKDIVLIFLLQHQTCNHYSNLD